LQESDVGRIVSIGVRNYMCSIAILRAQRSNSKLSLRKTYPDAA
jgi:hypothetical protein